VVTIIKDGGVNVETGLTRTFWDTLGGKKTVKGKNRTILRFATIVNTIFKKMTKLRQTEFHNFTFW
jgi:hypothetical protein